FSFEFRAHEVGDANRSAQVERSFDHIENNYLAGRNFSSWPEVNSEAQAFCDRINARVKRHLHAAPRDLFASERLQLKPLPVFVPEVNMLHGRIVDTEGFVNVRKTRYTAPWQLIGRRVEVRETRDTIEIYDGPRRVGCHRRVIEPMDTRV